MEFFAVDFESFVVCKLNAELLKATPSDILCLSSLQPSTHPQPQALSLVRDLAMESAAAIKEPTVKGCGRMHTIAVASRQI
jgi:glutamate 5-kinase